jgi:hypothetical protein
MGQLISDRTMSVRGLAGAAFAVAAVLSPAVASADVFSNYEDLTEGFLGETFVHNGVTYRDVNRVNGFYPDGTPFNSTENGNELIIERATLLYNDFPTYGSPVNALNFGSSFINGDNLTIGALASVWMDLAAPGSSAGFDLAFYENGPWGNIEFRLEALNNGQVVATDTYTLSNLGGRDNVNWRHFSVSAPGGFDQLHLSAWLNGSYTAPRGLLDNLTVTAVPEPASMALAAIGAGALIARRRRHH